MKKIKLTREELFDIIETKAIPGTEDYEVDDMYMDDIVFVFCGIEFRWQNLKSQGYSKILPSCTFSEEDAIFTIGEGIEECIDTLYALIHKGENNG